jgi:hypothetical protein
VTGVALGAALGIDLCPRTVLTGDPSDLIVTADRVAWYRSDSGVTESGSRVSAWADVWGNGNLAQATGSAQPLVTDDQFGDYPGVINDDGARWMTSALAVGATVGARPYIWLYAKLTTHASTLVWCGLSVAGSAPRVFLGHTATAFLAVTSSGAVSSTVFTGPVDTNNRLHEGGLTTNGFGQGVLSGASSTAANTVAITTGTAATAGLFTAGAAAAGGAVGMIAEMIVSRAEPTAPIKAAMRAYFAARYGAI